MSERGYSPERPEQPKLNDMALLLLLTDAARLFDSEQTLDQQYLEEKLLPVLSEHFGQDLLVSDNTKSFLEDKLSYMRDKMDHHPEPHSEDNPTIDTEMQKWKVYSKMMRELDRVKKDMANDATRDAAIAELHAQVLWASMNLRTTIVGESPQALITNLDAAIRKAAEKSEKKIALARGLDYAPDMPE